MAQSAPTRACVIAILSACLLFAPLRAAACSIQEVATDEEKFAKAKEVFLARVVRVEEAAKPERWGNVEFKAVQGTYKLLEVFKGEPRDGDTVLDFVFNPGNCSLGIMAGLHYVFLIRPENRLVLWVGGSRGYVNLEGSVPKADIARFRALARKPESVPNR
jgi:hypothetical protein